MKNTHQKIDDYIRKERYKNIIYVSGILIGLVIFFLIVYLPPLGKQSDILGTVKTLTAVQHDEGHSLRLIVVLGSGKEVRVAIPRSRFYQQGKTVKLRKIEPLLFGRTLYSFRGYANNDASNIQKNKREAMY